MMDISKFTEYAVPEKSKAIRNSHPQIFLTASDRNISFSSTATRSLAVSHVKLMVNEEDGKVLILESEDGLSFVKNVDRMDKSDECRVVWGRNDIVSMINKMIPAEKKTSKSIRINGELVDVDGKRGILFTCK